MSTQERYTIEFKREAVRLALTRGETIVQPAADLGIPEAKVHAWRRNGTGDSRNCTSLRAEYRIQQAIMYGFIEAPSENYPIEVVCGALEVNPSGYYAWRVRPESERAQSNRALREQIDAA